MKTLHTAFNYIHEISLTKKDAEMCSHPGNCDIDVRFVSNKPYVKKQLNAIDKDQLVKELDDYGAWNDEDLQDHQQNLQRISWIAAGNINENSHSTELTTP